MSTWQYQIFLTDGRRAGERIIINSEPDGQLPFKVTLPDPGATTSTTYWLVPAMKERSQQVRAYQSALS
ncbi:MAG TPA: hypothetical protein VFE65_18110 [Pseudonocardia sp.]|jgi:hypothetical protein|nr:hypothetical protein [Pseudonocardia sp.]